VGQGIHVAAKEKFMNIQAFIMIVALALPVAVISLTITKAGVFEPLRKKMNDESFLKKLATCPYCMSHWISILVTVIYRPVVFTSSFYLVDLFISALTIVAVSTPLCWFIYRSYKTIDPSNRETNALREALMRARDKLVEQEQIIKRLLHEES
jgi:hypothetical protein